MPKIGSGVAKTPVNAPRPTTTSDYKGGTKTIGPAAAVTNIANKTGRTNPTPLGNLQQDPATGSMYVPGSAEDPAVRAYWQQVYEEGLARDSVSSAPVGTSNDYGGASAAPAQVAPSIPAVFQSPAQYTAPSVQAPQSVTAVSDSVANAPTGLAFEALGNGGGTIGSFERMRQQRSPRSDLSVTPEMLRAAAKARMGSF